MVEITKRRVIRQDYILNIVAGKDTLDLGCVAANGLMELHRRIRAVAKSCVGLDLVAADGVMQGDAQNFDFNNRFDIIVAGEVVEHLVHVRGLLESAARSLKPGGHLILTTPNPYALIALRCALFGRIVPNERFHVALYDPTVLRNLLDIAVPGTFTGTICYYEEDSPGTMAYRLNKWVSKVIRGFSSGILADLVRC